AQGASAEQKIHESEEDGAGHEKDQAVAGEGIFERLRNRSREGFWARGGDGGLFRGEGDFLALPAAMEAKINDVHAELLLLGALTAGAAAATGANDFCFNPGMVDAIV